MDLPTNIANEGGVLLLTITINLNKIISVLPLSVIKNIQIFINSIYPQANIRWEKHPLGIKIHWEKHSLGKTSVSKHPHKKLLNNKRNPYVYLL